jgi:hypothetical protein
MILGLMIAVAVFYGRDMVRDVAEAVRNAFAAFM